MTDKEIECAYKQLTFYKNCSTCEGGADSEICYVSKEELAEHLREWDKHRLAKELGDLL